MSATAIALFLSAFALISTSQVEYTVLKIADGDTITVRNDETSSNVKVRFL
jgi:endonuclease YncB( thermonuclease family)